MPGKGSLATLTIGALPPVGSDKLPQPATLPTIKPLKRTLAPRVADPTRQFKNGQRLMWLIVLEAVGALAVLLFVVWWTMFSGRRSGELPTASEEVQDDVDRGGSKKLKG